jgi:hypothetical protein
MDNVQSLLRSRRMQCWTVGIGTIFLFLSNFRWLQIFSLPSSIGNVWVNFLSLPVMWYLFPILICPMTLCIRRSAIGFAAAVSYIIFDTTFHWYLLPPLQARELLIGALFIPIVSWSIGFGIMVVGMAAQITAGHFGWSKITQIAFVSVVLSAVVLTIRWFFWNNGFVRF